MDEREKERSQFKGKRGLLSSGGLEKSLEGGCDSDQHRSKRQETSMAIGWRSWAGYREKFGSYRA